MAYIQGKFKPKFPKKYLGNPNNIEYRSSWELQVMCNLDRDANVISWASEEIAIPYQSPVDMKMHRYFPDFVVKRNDGKIYMLEIKPAHQTRAPKLKNRSKQRILYEAKTYAVNQAKWAAAIEFCKKNGMIFQVLTEKELKLG